MNRSRSIDLLRSGSFVFTALAAGLFLGACSKMMEGFQEGFKNGFRDEFVKSCTQEAGGDAEVAEFCACVGNYLVEGKTAGELTAMASKFEEEGYIEKIIDESGCMVDETPAAPSGEESTAAEATP